MERILDWQVEAIRWVSRIEGLPKIFKLILLLKENVLTSKYRKWAFLLRLWLTYKLFRWIQKRFTLTRQLVHNSAVLVTGCDSGFGKDISLRLSAKGIRVFSCCLTQDGVNALKNRGRIIPFQMDVTKNSAVETGIQFVEKELKKRELNLWAVINNAGIMRIGEIDVIPFKDYELMVQVNLMGVIRITRACLPLLRKSKGRIINIASVVGIMATPTTAVYSATKFAVEGLSDALRRELSPWGIKVIKIEPSIMKTPLWSHTLTKQPSMDSKFEDLYGKEYFKKRQAQTKQLFDFGDNPIKIIDAMEHCVTCRYPEVNYVVGWDRGNWKALGWYFPYCVTDFIIGLVSPKPKPFQSTH